MEIQGHLDLERRPRRMQVFLGADTPAPSTTASTAKLDIDLAGPFATFLQNNIRKFAFQTLVSDAARSAINVSIAQKLDFTFLVAYGVPLAAQANAKSKIAAVNSGLSVLGNFFLVDDLKNALSGTLQRLKDIQFIEETPAREAQKAALNAQIAAQQAEEKKKVDEQAAQLSKVVDALTGAKQTVASDPKISADPSTKTDLQQLLAARDADARKILQQLLSSPRSAAGVGSQIDDLRQEASRLQRIIGGFSQNATPQQVLEARTELAPTSPWVYVGVGVGASLLIAGIFAALS